VRLLSLEEAAEAEPAEVGGKARGLARLAQLGLPVPEALVLPAAAHERWQRGGAVTEEEARHLWQVASTLGETLAVRSSAADEDSSTRSAAGQYESVMDVRDAVALRAAVERCFSAAHEPRATAYRRGVEVSRLALVLQTEIAAERSGVAFSIDPVSGSRESIVIEAAFGHGHGIVSGELTPDRYFVNRRTGTVRARLADKVVAADGCGRLSPLPRERRFARTLRDHEAGALAALVGRAEAGFRQPVDVEFCFVGETPWLLQCRPITTVDGAD
jgi:pyruvate,water dikinase